MVLILQHRQDNQVIKQLSSDNQGKMLIYMQKGVDEYIQIDTDTYHG